MKRLFPALLAGLLIGLLFAGCGDGGTGDAGPITTTSSTTVPADADTSTTSGGTPATTIPPTTGTSDTTLPPADTATTLTVYFLNSDGEAISTTRTVTTQAVAAAAMGFLIEGPTPAEEAAGLSTAVPTDSLVLGIEIADGIAFLDMSREFEAGGGSMAILGRLAQVVYTLTEFPTVDRVQILLDGEEAEYFSGEGVIIADPLTPEEFNSAVPFGGEFTGSSASVWDQGDLPTVTEGNPDVFRVVLVAADDVLNVRSSAGVDAGIIGKLVPGAAVRGTGGTASVGTSEWMEINTPVGPGWVNGLFLTSSVAAAGFPDDVDPTEVVAELAARFAAGEDFSSLVSEKGLWVAHHAPPIRFSGDDLDGILDDPTTYRWGSNALEPDSPEITPQTFSGAIAEPFVSVWDDPDAEIKVDAVTEGPNGRTADYIVPTEFDGFGYVSVFDSGDNPAYDGLDWMEWVVSLAWENDQVKIVGLTIDQWAP